MSDKEKVIDLLFEISEYFRDCRSNASFASKEENHFWELQNAASEAAVMLKEQQEIVRCKDCKYGAKINQVHGDDVMHLCHSSVFSSGKCVHLHDADWFCADGERR